MRYRRRSALLQHLAEMAGVLLAGRGGVRLLQNLKAPLSRTSVLFRLMRMPLPLAPTPQVLGVDDFALYADTYGTLLVDAESRLPIELWSGRDAGQLASWLRAHPGVRVVCRDGPLVYREGITDGAPHAVQVSDRFMCGRAFPGGCRTWPLPIVGACPPRFPILDRLRRALRHRRSRQTPRPAATRSGSSRRCTR